MAQSEQLMASASDMPLSSWHWKLSMRLWWLVALSWHPAMAQEEGGRSLAFDEGPVMGDLQPAEESTPPASAADPRENSRWRLAKEISRHFRVASEHAMEVVEAAFAAGERHGLPATVILGLIAVESDFRHLRLKGNRRRGFGLMQIYGKPAGEDDGALPTLAEHVDSGARLLRRYLDLYQNLPRALQRYKGQLDRAPHYAQRILDWQARFDLVLACPERALVAPKLRVRKPLPSPMG